ncbi:MAG TPA: DUF6265 family protein [Gemmatimonadales bacterium]
MISNAVRAMIPALALGTVVMTGRPADAGHLAWMAGCWEFTRGETTVEEQWMAPRGGALIGMSRTVRGDRMVAFESVVIRADSAGRLAYHAFPSGQAPAVFPAVEVTDSTAVFENPTHDFPQRILYRRRGDTLSARVEGSRNGTLRGSDFPYQRTACPGGAGGGHH